MSYVLCVYVPTCIYKVFFLPPHGWSSICLEFGEVLPFWKGVRRDVLFLVFFSGEKYLKCLITSFSMKFVPKSEQGSCGVK